MQLRLEQPGLDGGIRLYQLPDFFCANAENRNSSPRIGYRENLGRRRSSFLLSFLWQMQGAVS
jgi:hypothetical protein